MAEAVFRQQVKEQGLGKEIMVDSAGTSSWHLGERPHEGTLKKLQEYDISSEGIRARKLTKQDAEYFDYIIAMDNSNKENITACFVVESPKVLRLLDLLENDIKEVPDPYYTGDFEQTYQLVTESCAALLEKIKAEKGL